MKDNLNFAIVFVVIFAFFTHELALSFDISNITFSNVISLLIAVASLIATIYNIAIFKKINNYKYR